MRVRRFIFLSAVIAVAGCADTKPSAAQEPSAASGAVLATVNGTAITESDVRAALGSELARLEGQVYDLKRQQLDELIAERLLDAEAARRGVTREALEAEEIAAKVTPVSAEELGDFVTANRARIRGDATALRPQIQAFLENRKLTERRAAFVEGLRAEAAVEVTLKAPLAFRATLDLEGAPIRGQVDAPITIVEFSDFHCPFCRSVQPTLTELLARYPGKVRLAYKHLPLDSLHPQARRASEASWCAGQQGKFWEYHDALYRDGGSDASDAAMSKVAEGIGLDVGSFATCLAGPEAARNVARDASQGEALGLTGTPGFYINGRELTGAQPLEAFVRIIDEELAVRP
jgi:protein-disulfide isomerase